MPAKKIILYHGTSARYEDAIRRDGLLPRNKTGNSNWDGDVISKEDLVYLTDAYPVYFALNAVDDKDDLLVVEVSVLESALYPDEDFIANLLHNQHYPDIPLRKINPTVVPQKYKKFALKSLQRNGVVATKSVSPDRIKRFVRLRQSKFNNQLLTIGADAMPIPLNYRVLGGQYRAAMQALFDSGLDAAVKVMREPFDRILNNPSASPAPPR